MRAILLSLFASSLAMAQTQVTQIVNQGGTGDFTGLVQWEAQHMNLVTLDQALTVQVEGSWSGPEASLQIDGWTTDATRKVTIKTVGAARHNGTWGKAGTHSVLATSGLQWAVNVVDSFVTLDGIQAAVEHTTPDSSAFWDGIGSTTYLNCLARRSARAAGIYGFRFSVLNPVPVAVNCVAQNYDWGFILWASGEGRFYNCTAISNGKGYGNHSSFAPSATWFNCIATGAGPDVGWSWSGFTATGTGNVSFSEIPFGTGGKQGNVTLVGGGDYHLAPSDTVARGYGVTDPAAGLYNTDFDGATRTAPWDAGADQFSTAPAGRGQVIITSQ